MIKVGFFIRSPKNDINKHNLVFLNEKECALYSPKRIFKINQTMISPLGSKHI